MKFGILIHTDSSTQGDINYVLEQKYLQTVERLWYLNTHFPKVDAVIIPSILNYEQNREGLKNSPAFNFLHEYASNGGFVFGVGNGYRLLCDFDLLPGNFDKKATEQSIDDHIFVKVDNNNTTISALYKNNAQLSFPQAAEKGKFSVPEKAISVLQNNNQIIFRYCDENGNINESSNPTGSTNNIAGICNEKRNVFGVAFHPERAVDEASGNTDGKPIFDSIIHIIGRSISRTLH